MADRERDVENAEEEAREDTNPSTRSSERTRSRSRSKSGGTRERHRVYRNPFLTYMQMCRLKKPGKRLSEVAKDAGKAWRAMSEDQKSVYVKMAKKAPKNTSARRMSRSRRRKRRSIYFRR